jgi:hypothetical protein
MEKIVMFIAYEVPSVLLSVVMGNFNLQSAYQAACA